MSWWDELFGRKKRGPKDYPWDWVIMFIGRTEEKFEKMCEARTAKLRKAVEALQQETDDVVVDEESRDPRVKAAWVKYNEIRVLREMRTDLIKRGWLPPREKDVLERKGTVEPVKWSFDRTYTVEELPREAQDFHPDRPDKGSRW